MCPRLQRYLNVTFRVWRGILLWKTRSFFQWKLPVRVNLSLCFPHFPHSLKCGVCVEATPPHVGEGQNMGVHVKAVVQRPSSCDRSRWGFTPSAGLTPWLGQGGPRSRTGLRSYQSVLEGSGPRPSPPCSWKPSSPHNNLQAQVKQGSLQPIRTLASPLQEELNPNVMHYSH